VRAIGSLGGELNGEGEIVVLVVEGILLLVELAGTQVWAVVVWFSVSLRVERIEEGFVDKVLVVVDSSGHGLVHTSRSRGNCDRHISIITTNNIRSHAQAPNKQSTHVSSTPPQRTTQRAHHSTPPTNPHSSPVLHHPVHTTVTQTKTNPHISHLEWENQA